jgi:hypothetical protein
MPRDITITFDDGSKHVYQGAPDDVTPDQVEARASKEFGKRVTALDGGKPAAPSAAPEPSFLDKAAQQVKNVAGGLARGAASIGATLTTPVKQYDTQGNADPRSFLQRRADTLQGVEQGTQALGADPSSLVYKGTKLGAEIAGTGGAGGAIAGGVRALAPSIAAKIPNLLQAVGSSGMTAGQAAPGVAGAAGNMLTRMGGGAVAGAAQTAMVDPESTGTGAAIGAALPPAAKAAGAVGSAVGSSVKSILSNVLGLSTGVGAEPIKAAVKAGAEGNKDFLKNIAGEVPLTDVLERAKTGLTNMRSAASAEYRSGMIPVKNDATVLDFSGLDKALQDAGNVASFKGQTTNETASTAVEKMKSIIEQWKTLDPAQFHTPEGFDALKRSLGGVLESIGIQERTARLAAGKVYNAAKDEIVQQAPAYAGVMKNYEAAAGEITEIERALSLGDKASKDTAMRKLQSLMRNNVQTNYGNRLSLANTLEKKGGVDLTPSIAGQAMNSMMPRSLSGQIGGGATMFTAMSNPLALAALPFQSPKLVGLGAYGLGRAGGVVSDVASMMANRLPMNQMAGITSPNDLAQLAYRLSVPLTNSAR